MPTCVLPAIFCKQDDAAFWQGIGTLSWVRGKDEDSKTGRRKGARRSSYSRCSITVERSLTASADGRVRKDQQTPASYQLIGTVGAANQPADNWAA